MQLAHYNRENDTVILTVATAAIFSHIYAVCLLVVERSGFMEHAREFIATLYIMVASGMSHIRRSPLSYYLLSSCFFFTFFSSYNSLLPPFFAFVLSHFDAFTLSRSLFLSICLLSSFLLSLYSVIFSVFAI